MMGNLFYRKVSITEILEMAYHEMEYWNNWHNELSKAEKEAGKSG